MTYAKPTLIYQAEGREYWLVYDGEAEVFAMFASEAADDPVGEFDTKAEALVYAKQHAQQEGA